MADINDDTEAPTICCPAEPRHSGRFTSGDCPVSDLHRHKGILRGLVHDQGAKPRVMHWHRNGRLSPKVKSPFDLEQLG